MEEFSGTPVQKLQAAYDSGATHIKATLPEYDFGAIAGDTSLFTFTRYVNIDFNGALIKVQGDNSGSFTGTAFITLADTAADISNYSFEDESFLQAGPSRGVVPVLILNTSLNTSDYTFSNFEIIKGQSLLTAFSDNPLTARASNIKFEGAVSGVDTYYGVNLANNGDNFVGEYVLGDFKRAFFAYGTDGADVKYRAKQGQPTSAALLISSTGNSSPDTKNYNIKGVYDALNGALAIKGQTAADTGVYRNINVDLHVKSLGVNKTNDHFFTLGDGSAASGTYTVEGLNLSLSSEVDFSHAVNVITSSPNIGTVRVRSNNSRSITGDSSSIKVLQLENQTQSLYVGSFLDGNVFICNEQLNQGQPLTSLFSAEVDVSLYNDFTFSGQRLSYVKYFISGYISSGGLPTLTDTTVLHRVDVGVAPHPTVVFTEVTGGIELSADTFVDANSRISATVKPLRL